MNNTRYHLRCAAASIRLMLMLLSLCAGALLVRSFFSGDLLAWHRSSFRNEWRIERQFSLSTGNGHLVIQVGVDRVETHSLEAENSAWKRKTFRPEDVLNLGWKETVLGRMGFAAHTSRSKADSYSYSRWTVGLPLWFLTFLFATEPLRYGLNLIRKTWRTSRGFCPACGYDQRGSQDLCPECGRTEKPGRL